MQVNITVKELIDLYGKIQDIEESYKNELQRIAQKAKNLESYLNTLHSVILSVDDKEERLGRLESGIKEWAGEDLPF
jgi:DNA anti-recombination protein RmuC